MIVDKKKQDQLPAPIEPEVNVTVVDDRYQTEQELIAGNALEDLYLAVSKVIKDLKVNPDDPNSKPLFRTVKWLSLIHI